MAKIILASASPRRRELMQLAGFDFEIVCADIDERVPENAAPQEVVLSLSLQKARAVAESRSDCTVIGADTVVALDGKILGKPHSEEDAAKMLRLLSGKKHKVFTGVAIVGGGRVKNFFDETEVEFYPLSEEEIQKYIATGEPTDKAGAYGIQGKGALLVKKIDGDFYNVVGLPIAKLYREMNSFV